MSSPSMPPDNSMQVAQMENQRADKAAAQAKQDAATKKAELLGLRTSAQGAGRTSASDYLTSQGVDAGAHSTDIDSTINSILGGISPDDPNPGSYFNDVGKTVQNNIQGGQRAKASRGLDAVFSPDFETKRLPFTVDDPYIAGIDAEQRHSADDIVKRMLDRGVITPTGYGAAKTDLDNQNAGVMSRLNEIGTNLIGGGQQSLRDVANRGRTAASTLNIDQPFNPGDFSSEVDRLSSEFLGNLGTNIRSRVTGNLFNTNGLGSLAGAAQGAQNTPFDPAALAGVKDTNKPKPEDTTQHPLF